MITIHYRDINTKETSYVQVFDHQMYKYVKNIRTGTQLLTVLFNIANMNQMYNVWFQKIDIGDDTYHSCNDYIVRVLKDYLEEVIVNES